MSGFRQIMNQNGNYIERSYRYTMKTNGREVYAQLENAFVDNC